jgi:hypothetical protein
MGLRVMMLLSTRFQFFLATEMSLLCSTGGSQYVYVFDGRDY